MRLAPRVLRSVSSLNLTRIVFLASLASLAVQDCSPAEDETLDYMVNAVAAMSLKDTEGAVKNLQLALTRRPSDPRIHLLLGQALAEGGKGNEALLSYQWAAYLSHDEPAFHAMVGEKISALLGSAPEAPVEPGGSLVLFDDRPSAGVSLISSAGPGGWGLEFAYRAFGSASLRLEAQDRKGQVIRFDIKGLLAQTPVSGRKKLLEALRAGALQFWLRAEAPARNLDFWFEFQYSSWEEAHTELSGEQKSGLPAATALSPFVDSPEGPVQESLTLGSQRYVTPDSEFQEVLIPLADFQGLGQELPWARIRSLVIRVPSSLHGRAYDLDGLRLVWDLPPQRARDLRLRRDAAQALARPLDPAALLFHDGLQEEFALFETDCQAIPANFQPTITNGPAPLPGPVNPANQGKSGPMTIALPPPFLRPGETSPDSAKESARRVEKLGLKGVDVAAVDPQNWSFLILDENNAYAGKRSLKVVADPHEGIGAFLPMPETDLSLIWPKACLHFMVKGSSGDEDFDISLFSRSGSQVPTLNGGSIGRWLNHVSTDWQAVSIPLADFGDRTPSGRFGWDRFTGLTFKSCPRSALENTFWVDEIWIGSCGSAPLPPENPSPSLNAAVPAPALKVEVDFRYTLPSDLAFDPGQALFKPGGAKELKAWALALRKKFPGSGLILRGHTDDSPLSKGSPFKSNEDLSLARAKAVKEFLVAETGYEQAEVSLEGLGAREPLVSNASPEGRAKNRRVEVQVSGQARQEVEEAAEEADRLLRLGLYKEAWQRYVKIAEVAYQDPQIWYRLAITADRAGDPDKAQEALNRMRMLLGK